MKLNVILMFVFQVCFHALVIQASTLQPHELERELRGLVKVKLHGEPLYLIDYTNAAKTVAFSPDGKHLVVGYQPGPVAIYDIVAEKAKRFDSELEKMKEEIRESELSPKL